MIFCDLQQITGSKNALVDFCCAMLACIVLVISCYYIIMLLLCYVIVITTIYIVKLANLTTCRQLRV